MATFEVFVPVQGEYIVTVEANSAEEAMRLITDGEVDWSEGTDNVEMMVDEGLHVQLVYGEEGDLDDDDDDDAEGDIDDDAAEILLLNGITLTTETGLPYSMRHFRL